jgi:LDH2 family malate/lactate/ureidoglycolate dehydrogenase
MLRTYLQQYRQGILNPNHSGILSRVSGTATIDGDRGLGMIQGPRAMRLAMEKAKQTGVGVVTIFNSGHLGAVGHHSMVAAKGDMVGMCMTATGAQVVPTFALGAAVWHQSYFTVAPARHEAVYFDVATSAIAGNRCGWPRSALRCYLAGCRQRRQSDSEETPASERGQFWHLPFGGTREQGSHKG